MSLGSLFGAMFGPMVPMAAPGVGAGPFRAKYHAYSPAFWDSDNRDRLELSDRVVLPESALEQLTRLSVRFPITFRITHQLREDPSQVWQSHCSVLEFTGDEGNVYLPLSMIDNLALDPDGGSVVELEAVTLPKGELVQFQAHETKFAMLRNPRVALDFYTTLTVGDTIQIAFPPDGALKHVYKFDVIKVGPELGIHGVQNGISIIETDIKVKVVAKTLDLEEKWCEDDADDEDEKWSTEVTESATTLAKSKYFDELERHSRLESVSSSRSVRFGARASPMRRAEEVIGTMRYVFDVEEATGERRLVSRLPLEKGPFEGSVGHSLKR